MQVAKSGIISKNTAARKISKFLKRFHQNKQFQVDSFKNKNLYLVSAYKILKVQSVS